ncbi:hypothetical protein [Psychrobacter sp. UBA5136]|uniref:hypothetical protein n=1 Tax=Psychrobacter sp. UBA5136 TaxID=1947356 RepID=UPI0025D29987|nr:hypothetical protein [Psychrobacter sp. UBA5136]
MEGHPIKSKNGNYFDDKKVQVVLQAGILGILKHARKILFTLKENKAEYKCQTVT